MTDAARKLLDELPPIAGSIRHSPLAMAEVGYDAKAGGDFA